jgi:hypothetical protein
MASEQFLSLVLKVKKCQTSCALASVAIHCCHSKLIWLALRNIWGRAANKEMQR